MTRDVYGWDNEVPNIVPMMDDAEIVATVTDAIAVHAQTPHGGSSAMPWEGKVAGACMDGDPNHLLAMMQQAGVVTPTPTQQTITVARCSLFRLNTALTVNRIRWYGVGATTAVYHMAIYQLSTLARVTADLNPNTTANAWNSVAVSPGVTLAANTNYFAAVSVDTTGTTPGIHACGASLAATAGQIQALPTNWPGNLDLDAGFMQPPAFFQFAVVAGVLPVTAAALTVPAAWTGGMPSLFLDNASAA